MAEKKIIVKNPRFWFHSFDDYGKIPVKEVQTGSYLYREQTAEQGAILKDCVNVNTRVISFPYSKQNAGVFSLTKTDDIVEWKKRKIIDSIEIKITTNVGVEDSACIFFSILQVNKQIVETIAHILPAISNQQLIPRSNPFELPMFLNSVKLENLNYSLPQDEDLILLQHIKFNEYIRSNNKGKYGIAYFPYVMYETCVTYSDFFM